MLVPSTHRPRARLHPGPGHPRHYRFAGGVLARYPELAAELVQLGPEVIVAVGGGAARAVGDATTTIPVVFVGSGDLVQQGRSPV